jgi:hypothetical protein
VVHSAFGQEGRHYGEVWGPQCILLGATRYGGIWGAKCIQLGAGRSWGGLGSTVHSARGVGVLVGLSGPQCIQHGA